MCPSVSSQCSSAECVPVLFRWQWPLDKRSTSWRRHLCGHVETGLRSPSSFPLTVVVTVVRGQRRLSDVCHPRGTVLISATPGRRSPGGLCPLLFMLSIHIILHSAMFPPGYPGTSSFAHSQSVLGMTIFYHLKLVVRTFTAEFSLANV